MLCALLLAWFFTYFILVSVCLSNCKTKFSVLLIDSCWVFAVCAFRFPCGWLRSHFKCLFGQTIFWWWIIFQRYSLWHTCKLRNSTRGMLVPVIRNNNRTCFINPDSCVHQFLILSFVILLFHEAILFFFPHGTIINIDLYIALIFYFY